MARWQGFSALQTVRDLLGKLAHDYGRMSEDHLDIYAAFDFFVTAEHLVDWRWPDDEAMRREARSQEPLATVSHLANGGKHWVATARHHQSVTGVSFEYRPSSDPAIAAAMDSSNLGIYRPFVIAAQTNIFVYRIQADGSVKAVPALVLAGSVLAFWRAALAPGGVYEVRPSAS